MIGVELVRDRKTKERAVEERNALVQAMFRRGVLILGAGRNALRLAPPLVFSKAQADSCWTCSSRRWRKSRSSRPRRRQGPADRAPEREPHADSKTLRRTRRKPEP